MSWACSSFLCQQSLMHFFQEACKIRGIGKQMAEKILEILESGHLRKLDHISESVSVLEIFSNIWGAGVKTAQMWYQQVILSSLYSSKHCMLLLC